MAFIASSSLVDELLEAAEAPLPPPPPPPWCAPDVAVVEEEVGGVDEVEDVDASPVDATDDPAVPEGVPVAVLVVVAVAAAVVAAVVALVGWICMGSPGWLRRAAVNSEN